MKDESDQKLEAAVRAVNRTFECGFDAIEQCIDPKSLEYGILAAVRRALGDNMSALWRLTVLKGVL